MIANERRKRIAITRIHTLLLHLQPNRPKYYLNYLEDVHNELISEKLLDLFISGNNFSEFDKEKLGKHLLHTIFELEDSKQNALELVPIYAQFTKYFPSNVQLWLRLSRILQTSIRKGSNDSLEHLYEQCLHQLVSLQPSNTENLWHFADYFETKLRNFKTNPLNSEAEYGRLAVSATQTALQCLQQIKKHQELPSFYPTLLEKAIVLLLKPELPVMTSSLLPDALRVSSPSSSRHLSNVDLAETLADEMLLLYNSNRELFTQSDNKIDLSRIHYLKGNISQRQLRFASALEHYETAIQHNTKNLLYQQQVKDLLFTLDRHKQDFKQLLALPSSSFPMIKNDDKSQLFPAALVTQSAEQRWNQLCAKYKLQDKQLQNPGNRLPIKGP